MDVFDLFQLIAERDPQQHSYREFLRVPALSAGLYTLPTGGVDPQQPHTEDEVYYIVSGQGAIMVGSESQVVRAGSVVFVAAHIPHHFHTITEDLAILVLFAPAEYTQRVLSI